MHDFGPRVPEEYHDDEHGQSQAALNASRRNK